MPPRPQKDRAARVAEAVEILRDLRAVGVPADAPAFAAIKARFDEWVRSGEPFAGAVPLPEYGRRAELLLPRAADVVATLRLRVVDRRVADVTLDAPLARARAGDAPPPAAA
jgi:hypothetical protein